MQQVTCVLNGVAKVFRSRTTRYSRYEVSEKTGNAYYLYKTAGKPDDRAELQVLETRTVTHGKEGNLAVQFVLPPSGVTLLTFRVVN